LAVKIFPRSVFGMPLFYYMFLYLINKY